MAYCRWSTDLGRCDIYAYADVAGGYTVHVAKRKRADRANAICRDLAKLPPVGIDAPSAGKSFNVPTLEELKKLLLSLRAEGLRFPDYVLEDIDIDIDSEIRGESIGPGGL